MFDNAVYPASTSKSFYSTAAQLSGQTQIPTQAKAEPCRMIEPSQLKEFSNPVINAVVALANETVRAGYGALVFCSSRGGCERDAELISRVLPGPFELAADIMEKRSDLMNDLRSSSTGLDPTLEKTVPFGVAFHRKHVSSFTGTH